MAKIYIEPAKARAMLSQQEALERALQALSQNVGGIRSGLNYKISGREAINARLRDAINQLNKEANSTKALRAGLEQIIVRYEQAENSNIDRIVVEKTSIQSGGGSSGGGGGGGSWGDEHDRVAWEKIFGRLTGFLEDRLNQLFPNITIPGIRLPSVMLPFLGALQTLEELDWETKLKVKSTEDVKKLYKDGWLKGLDNFEKAHQTDLSSNQFYWDPKTGQKTYLDKNDPAYEEKLKALKEQSKNPVPVNVKLLSVGGSAEASLWEPFKDSEGLKWDHGGLDYNVKAGTFSGTAAAYFGATGMGATLGAGFTAFSADAKGYVGTEDANLYLKGKVEVGKVDAKAGAEIGFLDQEGKVNPNLYVSASAEALGGELSGTLGGEALGVDVGVTGSVNYGLGAHFNAGYRDGTFSVDMGATVGLGVGVKIDIDVSEAVENIGNTIENIGNAVGDVAEGIGNAVGNAVEGVGNGVRSAFSWVGSLFE